MLGKIPDVCMTNHLSLSMNNHQQDFATNSILIIQVFLVMDVADRTTNVVSVQHGKLIAITVADGDTMQVFADLSNKVRMYYLSNEGARLSVGKVLYVGILNLVVFTVIQLTAESLSPLHILHHLCLWLPLLTRILSVLVVMVLRQRPCLILELQFLVLLKAFSGQLTETMNIYFSLT